VAARAAGRDVRGDDERVGHVDAARVEHRQHAVLGERLAAGQHLDLDGLHVGVVAVARQELADDGEVERGAGGQRGEDPEREEREHAVAEHRSLPRPCVGQGLRGRNCVGHGPSVDAERRRAGVARRGER
jgi:hypothetical protein